MNDNNLARDAFSAQEFTGHPPIDSRFGHAIDPGFAAVENQALPEGRVVTVLSWERHDFATKIISTSESFQAWGQLLQAWAQSLEDEGQSLQVREQLVRLFCFSVSDESWLAYKPDGRWGLKQRTTDLWLILFRFKTHLPDDTFSAIANRLPILLDAEEWEEGDKLPDKSSFTKMIAHLTRHPEFKPPRIVLTREGYFMISWRTAEDKLVSMEFRSGDMVRWLVFAPPKSPHQQKRWGTGEDPIELLLNLIRLYGAFEWMRRD